ncbi:MAG: hypothetical protein LBK56_05230, partial [Gracilibacteraceae bacterium]|nr:hypothetical protein [Gracilibacteraceae bacterium]
FFTYAAPHFAEFFRFRARDPWKVRIVILKNRFCRQSQVKDIKTIQFNQEGETDREARQRNEETNVNSIY